MAKFLNADESYQLFQRELPEGAYASVEYSKALSTSSVYAKAVTIAAAYSNLKVIYDNMFPQSSVDKIDDWVLKCFGSPFPGGTPVSVKQQSVVAKLRQQPNLSLWQILTTIVGLVPAGTYVQIVTYRALNVGWPLGKGKLGRDTYLSPNGNDTLAGFNYDNWNNFIATIEWRLGRGKLGTTTHLAKYSGADIARRQHNAYGYEIRIFGITLSAALRQSIDKQASMIEPARSSHIIRDGLNLADFGLVNTVNNVGQFDLVNCIAADVTQTTGYIGLTQ